ncbi:MAG TPA: hypothetical protein VMM79_10310 [Longimicrobiales bacterium]|nr:hypothetical protein [Longimicrobiales bacterium]
MHFVIATDRATGASITLSDVAEACGVSRNLIDKARMDPDGPHARRPPEGWQTCLAKLCRERASALVKLADTLDPQEG